MVSRLGGLARRTAARAPEVVRPVLPTGWRFAGVEHLMRELEHAGVSHAVLVATDEGQALYASLGW